MGGLSGLPFLRITGDEDYRNPGVKRFLHTLKLYQYQLERNVKFFFLLVKDNEKQK